MKAKVHMPIVLITAYGDIPMAVRAMKVGAIDFLTKPFCSQTHWMRFHGPETGSGPAAKCNNRTLNLTGSTMSH